MSASYFQHPIKCLACGLHFIVCSDFEDWPKEGTTAQEHGSEITDRIYCPECGSDLAKLHYQPRSVEGFIFQAVPGESLQVKLG